MTNFIKRYGIDLHKLGYDVVPIPLGSKGCFVKGWQTFKADEGTINNWSIQYAGCGIRGPLTVGVDIDCRDDDLTQYMLSFVRKRLGFSPHRIGCAPKALLPYRCEASFKKLKSAEFNSPDGNKHMLEILADGQQFVTSHIHPETQQPYKWYYDDEVTAETLTVPWADLPLITEVAAREIVTEFEAQCQDRGWENVTPKKLKRAYPSVKGRRKYTEEDVRDMLSYLDPDMPYSDWLSIGMALHHEGFSVALWDSWSKKSSKYKAGECRAKWASFSNGGQA